jgi:hypothetical protein
MLHAYRGQEVFILAQIGSVSEEDAITIFRTIEEMNNFLNTHDEEELEDMRVLHGYLTAGNIIPTNFSGLFPYLIIENPVDPGTGFIVESDADTPEELAAQIEHALAETDKTSTDEEYDIEKIFVLYGYEISLQLDVYNVGKLIIHEFDVNQFQADEAQKVSDSVEKIQRKLEAKSRGPK